jgi:phosphopantetheinyl transferase
LNYSGLSLSPDEWQRYDRLRDPAAKSLYAFSRLFLRWTLSAAVDGSRLPHHWQFAKGKNDRPVLADDEDQPQLRFSLSRGRRAAAVAVSRALDVGLDLEPCRLQRGMTILYDFLTREERQRIRRLPVTHREAEFVRIWTVKEARAKLDGRGVAAPCFSAREGRVTAGRASCATFVIPRPEPYFLTVAWAPSRTLQPRVSFRSLEGWTVHLADHLVTEDRVDEYRALDA